MTLPNTRPAALAGRVRILLLLCFVLLFLLALWISVRAFLSEYRSIEGGPSRISEGDRAGLPPVVEVSWVTNDRTVRGWLGKGHRPQAILLVHGSGGNRLAVKDELIILSNAGFTVLAYDQPGHGESDGPTSYGAERRSALRDAARFLKNQPGVQRVGALGLSYGGYDLIHVAVTTPEIESIAVGGTPGDLLAHSHYEYQGAFGLRFFGARLAMQFFDVPLGETSAEKVVARLAPRPILVLHGALDSAVPRELTAPIYEAARAPKLWALLPNSGHCNYAENDKSLYTKIITDFFAQALSQDHATTEP